MRFRVLIYPPSMLPRTDPNCGVFELGVVEAASREAVVTLLEGQTIENPKGTDFIPGEFDYEIEESTHVLRPIYTRRSNSPTLERVQ